MSRLSMILPDELHRRFKAACTLGGKEMTEIITKFVEGYVAKAEKRKLIPVVAPSKKR